MKSPSFTSERQVSQSGIRSYALVLALDSEPLDVVREVVSRERVLVEDAAHPGDGDSLVGDGVRPADRLGKAKLGAQVLVAALEVVALDDEAGRHRGEPGCRDDHERPASRRSRPDVVRARFAHAARAEQAEDEDAGRDRSLQCVPCDHWMIVSVVKSATPPRPNSEIARARGVERNAGRSGRIARPIATAGAR